MPETILVVGDANADVSAELLRFPEEGSDAPIRTLRWESGGVAANTATALAALGTRARLLACVGQDPAAVVALAAAQAAGVDCIAVQYHPYLATGLCFAAISPGGERTFFSSRGANTALQSAPNMLDDIAWVHVGGHALLENSQRQTVLDLLALAVSQGIPCSLDLCEPLLHSWPGLIETLHTYSVVFVSRREIDLVAAGDTPEASAQRLLAAGAGCAVIKLGERGCLAGDGTEVCREPGIAVETLDTTGCGDAFAAGWLTATLANAPLAERARLANAAGALAATMAGATAAFGDAARVRAWVAGAGEPGHG